MYLNSTIFQWSNSYRFQFLNKLVPQLNYVVILIPYTSVVVTLLMRWKIYFSRSVKFPEAKNETRAVSKQGMLWIHQMRKQEHIVSTQSSKRRSCIHCRYHQFPVRTWSQTNMNVICVYAVNVWILLQNR